jgi:hypothetical protein
MSERGFSILALCFVLAGGCYSYTGDSGSDTGACDESVDDSRVLEPECSDDYDLLCHEEDFHFEPGSCYIVQLDLNGVWTAYETTFCPWAS